MIKERIHIASIDSTNSTALEQARAGLEHGIVVVADEQRKGRGRLGRKWISPKGNLYCSILLPPLREDEPAPVLSLVAANAVYETIAPFVDRSTTLSIKWPNDILINGMKVAGILLEATNCHGMTFIVVGVGINIVAETISHLPHDIAVCSTALELILNRAVGRDEILKTFLERFEYWHARFREHGSSPVCRTWNQRCNCIGQRLEAPSRGMKGTCRGVNDQGNLILDTEKGQILLDSEEVLAPTE
jgi:BirA family biotin operon repressor/biotin-[acetyl-CoA-carboxylase] ligase